MSAGIGFPISGAGSTGKRFRLAGDFYLNDHVKLMMTMKKTLTLLTILMVPLTTFAQPRKYIKSMGKALEMLQEASGAEQFVECAAAFDEISTSYEKMWMPPYYAAYSLISASFNEGDYSLKDEYLTRAGLSLEKVLALEPEESEVHALSAFHALGLMASDPESNGPIYLEDFNYAIEQAKALNPDNPRPYYMEGLLKANLPEFMGGGAAAAKSTHLMAAEKFKNFKTDDPLWPSWGEALNQEQLHNMQ